MSFVSGVFQVGDQQPLLLSQDVANLFTGLIKNTGKKTAFFGAEDVTVDKGFPLEPGEVVESNMHAKAAVYAIAANGGTELRWLTVT